MLKKFILICLVCGMVFGGFTIAIAQTLPQIGGTPGTPPQAGGVPGSQPGGIFDIPNPLQAETFSQLFAAIISWILGIVGLLAVVVIIYGGIQYMVAAGNQQKTSDAIKTIKNAIIGLIIVLMSYAILNLIKEIIGVKTP